eukprot:4352761-Pyramimonas_sp.AAC.1
MREEPDSDSDKNETKIQSGNDLWEQTNRSNQEDENEQGSSIRTKEKDLCSNILGVSSDMGLNMSELSEKEDGCGDTTNKNITEDETYFGMENLSRPGSSWLEVATGTFPLPGPLLVGLGRKEVFNTRAERGVP